MGRISQIPEEQLLQKKFQAYFADVSAFIGSVGELYHKQQAKLLEKRSLEECTKDQRRLYRDVLPENYEKSFLNPAFAAEELEGEVGEFLSFLCADILAMIPAAFEGRQDILTIYAELFSQVYGCFTEEPKAAAPDNSYKNAREAVYWFYHDYCEIFAAEPVMSMVDPQYDFFTSLVMNADLSDNRYLYRYGACIGENETKMAEYLRTLPQESIAAMARTFTQGYRVGFEVTRKDLTKKKTVKIEFPIGFERIVRQAVLQFREMGLEPVMAREAVTSFAGRGGAKRGCYSTSVNKQFDYDHKDDRAWYFDKSFVERRLEVLRDTFEKQKELAAAYGGRR